MRQNSIIGLVGLVLLGAGLKARTDWAVAENTDNFTSARSKAPAQTSPPLRKGGRNTVAALSQAPSRDSSPLAMARRRDADPDQIVVADLVFKNAKIWTVNQKQPEAQSLAIWRERILSVGSDAQIAPLIGPATQVIDLAGKRVVPGFHDCHVHFLNGGRRLSQVSLKDAADEAEFGRRLSEYSAKLPRDRWMLGGGWDHDRALHGVLPTAELIDKYVANRPVFLNRYDGHMAIVNSVVLKLAGITASTKDPPGGVIYRKPGTNEPTGLLRDNAMGLVTPFVPEMSADEILESVQASLAEARRLGMTSIEDMDGSGAAAHRQLLRLYQELAKQGKLTARISLRWPLAEWEQLARFGVESGFGDDWVRIGGLKGYVDGSLGSNTAKMYEPYLNEPGTTGIFITPLDKLRQYALGADKAGLNVAVHAIGDQANAEILNIFSDVARANGPRDRRFRIEHAQHLRPDDYARFRDAGVVPSMQPYHVIDDGRWAEGRIGSQRCASSYAYRSLLDAGAKLAFGSDWPVAPLSALPGIDAAVNRRTLDGKNPNGWFRAQRINVREAIEAYTLTAAYATFVERDRGSLEPGKLADLVVLARDILDPIAQDQIAETKVDMTVVGGKIVYHAGK
jgi:predicted amidohydrolase YtcJ